MKTKVVSANIFNPGLATILQNFLCRIEKFPNVPKAIDIPWV